MTDRPSGRGSDRDMPTRQADLQPDDRPGLEKDPSEWVTGDEPMTGAQASYLETLSRQTGDAVAGDLTKAEASEKIDELRDRAGLPDRDRG